MAAVNISLSQDQFICSLCLEILKAPVTIPCGHNYCMSCIEVKWDQSKEYSCPQCAEHFDLRPVLHQNAILVDIVKALKAVRLISTSLDNFAGPEDIPCDVCPTKKQKAILTCLTCLASFCEMHFQPHRKSEALKKHKVEKPTRNLEHKMCSKHEKLLEVFCRTDQSGICHSCVMTEHRDHDVVISDTQRAENQSQLEATLKEIKKKLQLRLRKVEEIRDAIDIIKISADKEVWESNKSFADLINCIEETCRKVTEWITEQDNREMGNAEAAIEQLVKEIEDLKAKDAQLTELLEIDDNIHFLQNLSSLCVPPEDKHSLCFTISSNFSTENVSKELSQLKKCLDKIWQWKIEKFTPAGAETSLYILQSPPPQSREEFLQYACDLTLDPNTANIFLTLSEGNRKVTYDGAESQYPDHPDRFDYWEQVLCAQALTGTRSYWEVEWNGREVEIGVTYKGICRKGEDDECRIGDNDMSWCLWCSDYGYSVCHNYTATVISESYSPRIGVYLDIPSGLLSFYSISDTMTLLYTFKASFTEPLYPGFWVEFESSVTICQLKTSGQ
ncbi:tripartite motif-containing protein 16-like [Polypterus senegalus]|uniref:tripartite motif-containing protein 16-like n=1 Tax=Polypterus senegalus TaxID=55291 RepID=UPI0019662578|nr:tripartite motif-containing protein 16-like [Polypterus senegalus]